MFEKYSAETVLPLRNYGFLSDTDGLTGQRDIVFDELSEELCKHVLYILLCQNSFFVVSVFRYAAFVKDVFVVILKFQFSMQVVLFIENANDFLHHAVVF